PAPFNTGQTGPVTVNAGDFLTGVDIHVTGPTPIPPGATVDSPSRDGPQGSGVPTVYWQDPITLSVTGCASGTGTATFTSDDGYSSSRPLTESPAGSGHYSATFPAPYPHHGHATITWTL